MSIDYLLGDDEDISIVNGTIQWTETVEQSSRQQALISLSTYRGEWLFNILAGIPYLKNDYNTISLLGKTDKRLLDSYLKRDILARENITEIISYSSVVDNNTRTFSLSFEAKTNEGSTLVVSNNTLTT